MALVVYVFATVLMLAAGLEKTLVSTGLVVMTGEITTDHKHDYARIARDTIHRIGYTAPDLRFDAEGCAVMVCYGRQSPDIAQGVDTGGAGDQPQRFL